MEECAQTLEEMTLLEGIQTNLDNKLTERQEHKIDSGRNDS